MDWNMVGAIGETLGAVGVIVTLVYLAGQLRQNTNALRSSTYQAYNEGSFSWADTIMQNAPEVAAIFQFGKYDDLDLESMTRANAFFLKTFTMMESSYLHHRAGSLDDDVFEAKMLGAETFLVRNQFARELWDTEAVHGFGITPDFKAYMDQRLAARSAQRNIG
jgi:hypothetical protein